MKACNEEVKGKVDVSMRYRSTTTTRVVVRVTHITFFLSAALSKSLQRGIESFLVVMDRRDLIMAR